MQNGSRSTRLFQPRPAGIPKRSDAPFWRGERAETIVEARTVALAAAKAAKKAARKTRAPGEPRARRPKTPSQQLRRLERALSRRKTLEARQRITQQIKTLKRELGIN